MPRHHDPVPPELPQDERWDQVIVLINYHSSNAQRMRQTCLRELEDSRYASRLFPIATSGDMRRDAENLSEQLTPDSVVVRAGGDGINKIFAQAALDASLTVPIVPLPGGNGNDLTKMLYGTVRGLQPSRILDYGMPVPIYPIVCDIEQSGEQQREVGINYAGLGWMAACGVAFNRPKYRRRPGYHYSAIRPLYEALSTAYTTVHTKNFTLVSDEGISREVFDQTYANGDRMAKFGRLPVKLSDPELLLLPGEPKSFMTIARRIGGMATGRMRATHVPLGSYDRFCLDSDGVYLQVDGETQLLQRGVTIKVSQSPQPIYGLSLR